MENFIDKNLKPTVDSELKPVGEFEKEYIDDFDNDNFTEEELAVLKEEDPSEYYRLMNKNAEQEELKQNRMMSNMAKEQEEALLRENLSELYKNKPDDYKDLPPWVGIHQR